MHIFPIIHIKKRTVALKLSILKTKKLRFSQKTRGPNKRRIKMWVRCFLSDSLPTSFTSSNYQNKSKCGILIKENFHFVRVLESNYAVLKSVSVGQNLGCAPFWKLQEIILYLIFPVSRGCWHCLDVATSLHLLPSRQSFIFLSLRFIVLRMATLKLHI